MVVFKVPTIKMTGRIMRSDHDHEDDHDDLDMSRSRSHDLVDGLDHGITGFDLLEHMISRSV